MEKILTKLVTPDSQAIQEGTTELKEAFKRPEAIPELCNILSNNAGPSSTQVRQYAALLLRKRFPKRGLWTRLDLETRNNLKDGCLQILFDPNDQDKVVKSGVAQLIGLLAKYEMKKPPGSSWPELLETLGRLLGGDRQCETAMLCISILAEDAGNYLKSSINTLVPHLANAMKKAASTTPLGSVEDQKSHLEAGFHAIQAAIHLVPKVGSDELKMFQGLVPVTLEFTRFLLVSGESAKGCEAMDIFEELADSEVGVIVPHIKSIVEFCLSVCAQKDLNSSARIKAITFLGHITKLKKKTILKHKLHIPMIDTLFPIICSPSSENDEDRGETWDMEENSPRISASQALDVLALNLPPEKYMSNLLRHIQPALMSEEPHCQRGAFYALAVSAEGCSENIRSKHLVNLLQLIATGIRSDNDSVRNAALYALGQFAEFLQPDISGFAGEILPILFENLDMVWGLVQQGQEHPPGVDRIFYALELFSENLEEKLVPFLPELMKRLVPMMGCGNNHLKEMSISGVGSAARAVHGELVMYFNSIMEALKPNLTLDYTIEENQVLVTQSMDTLGSIAKAVGPTNFAPDLAEECCKLGLQLVEKHDDPDIRKCAYSLLASVAYVAKNRMASVLPQIVSLLVKSIKTEQGINFELKEDNAGIPLEKLFDEDDDDADVDEDQDGDDIDDVSLGSNDTESVHDYLEKIKGISVENSFLHEKEQAALTLSEICLHTDEAFGPFIKECFEEVWEQMSYPDEEVRRANIQALSQLTIAMYKLEFPEFRRSVEMLVPKVLSMIKEEEDVNVVFICLEMLADLLKECGKGMTAVPGVPDMVYEAMLAIMKSQCACMDSDEVEDDADGEEAEQDEILFESAGEILPNLGRAMESTHFLPYFSKLFQFFMKRTKNTCTVAEKSFSVGSLAECLESLNDPSCPLAVFVNPLMTAFLPNLGDEDKDVRNNAIYGIGELAYHGGAAVFPHFPVILQSLSNQLSRETAPKCFDQIVGAVCRLILSDKTRVPLKEVVPVIFQHLPLKEDFTEYIVVYRCVRLLYTDGVEEVKVNMGKILEMSVDLHSHLSQGANLSSEATFEMDKEKTLKELIAATLKQFAYDFPNEFKSVTASMTNERSEMISLMLQ